MQSKFSFSALKFQFLFILSYLSLYMGCWTAFIALSIVGVTSGIKFGTGRSVREGYDEGTRSTVRVVLPSGVVYPEHGVEKIAEVVKSKIVSNHASINVTITLVDSNDKNLILDSEITKPLFQNEQQNTYYVGLAHSKVALEMATFLKMPTMSFSTLTYIDNGTQVPLNPQYWTSTKGLFNLLHRYEWTRVNFIFSTLPWYEHTWLMLEDNIKKLNGKGGVDESVQYPKIETRTDKFIFPLDSYNKKEAYFVELVHSAQTSNIFVFIGHVCELRRYLTTAYKYGFLVPGKIIIYLDIYGNMVVDSPNFAFSKVNCIKFSGWLDYTEDEDVLRAAMEYVIVGLTHWTDLNKVDRSQFSDDYKLNALSDCSGFDILIADSINLISQYITQTGSSKDLTSFITDNQDSLGLYSGKVEFDEEGWRRLRVGVRFFHGKGNVEFMTWENNCEDVYCPKTTHPGPKVHWVGEVIPTSAFKEKETGTDPLVIVLPLLSVLLVIGLMGVATIHIYKKQKCVSSQKLWSLDRKNFQFDKMYVLLPKKTHDGAFPKTYNNVRNLSGRYKNCEVFIKEIYNCQLNISRNYELTTEILKRVGGKNENVNFLIGILERSNNILLVQPLSSNGSLVDVLHMNPMNIMDNFDFKLHVLLDISRGMSFLHDSLNIPHTNLKTSNCVVDSRWTVKVSDFEPPPIKQCFADETAELEHCNAQRLWTAPELLDSRTPGLRGLKLCDVYSFGMVSYHVLANALPYHSKGEHGEVSFSEIIKRVKERSEPPFRPQLKMSECNDIDELCKLVKDCWSQRPRLRPSFVKISETLDGWNTPGLSFGDFIATQMEEYSYGLDQKVKGMEDKLANERQEFEKLLQKMLPRQIANCIKAGRQPSFEQADVSLYFSDIYNFAKISQLKRFRDDPKLIVEFLNGLYEILDTIVSCFQEKLYKVETINDSYLVMSGLPVRQDRNYHHAGFIANFALLVLSRVNEIELEGYPDLRIQIRIGIHSGKLAAGVIGKLNPRYCLFGDTVNFTSRLESTGKPFTIHTSKNTVDLLKQHDGLFKIVERAGKVTLKNRGEHQTYFVVGMAGFEWDLPKETLRLGKRGDTVSDGESVTSYKTGDSVSWGYGGGDPKRKVSTASTEYSFTESSSAINTADSRSKKLSNSKLDMQNSVSQSMSLIDKMRKPVDKSNEFDGERPARRAFSAPDGGHFTMEEKKQRMSTPFRKESDESLYLRGKEGRGTNCLLPIPEPGYSTNELITPPEGNTADTSPNNSRCSSQILSDPLDEQGIAETAGVPLSKLYNHEDTVPDREDADDTIPTPTNVPNCALKRRGTNQTLVAPATFALANCSMGKKRYSCRKKPPPSSYEHDSTESDDTGLDFDNSYDNSCDS